MRVENVNEIPKKSREDIHSVYNIECERIKDLVEREVLSTLGGRKNENAKNEAKITWNNLRDQIKSCSQKRGNGDSLRDFMNGKAKKETPTRGEILGWLISTLIATIIELVVLGIIISFEFKGEGVYAIFPFIPAILLAVGGWLAGVGWGGLLAVNKFNEGEERKKKRRQTISIILLIAGILAVLITITIRFLSALKYGGSPITVVLITVGLGVIIIIPKTVHRYYKGVRKHYEEELFLIQQHIAWKKHSDDDRDNRWVSYHSDIIKNNTQ